MTSASSERGRVRSARGNTPPEKSYTQSFKIGSVAVSVHFTIMHAPIKNVIHVYMYIHNIQLRYSLHILHSNVKHDIMCR